MTTQVHAWRPICFAVGVAATIVGLEATRQYGLALEGKESYLRYAAPIVAVMVSLIPPLAGWFWRRGENVLGVLWWLAIIPCGFFMFFLHAERSHHAREGFDADIQARQNAVWRASKNLEEIDSKLKPLERDWYAAKSNPNCGNSPSCRTTLAMVNDLKDKKVEAETALVDAEKAVKGQSKFRAETWLLPLCLELIAFLAIWSALSGSWWSAKTPMTEEQLEAVETGVGVLTKLGRLAKQKKEEPVSVKAVS